MKRSEQFKEYFKDLPNEYKPLWNIKSIPLRIFKIVGLTVVFYIPVTLAFIFLMPWAILFDEDNEIRVNKD